MFDPLIGFLAMSIMQGPIKGIWNASTHSREVAVGIDGDTMLFEDGDTMLFEDVDTMLFD